MAAVWMAGLSGGLWAEDNSKIYAGKMHIPLDLHTPDGVLLEKGIFQVEVRIEKEHHLLVFLRDGQMVAAVNGRSRPGPLEATIPILGTTFLHDTAIPIGTEAERHFSKTGRAQYEEETRDWKAHLRTYRSLEAGGKEIELVFQERQSSYEEWSRVVFSLVLKGEAAELASLLP